jgi:hypothetical protein
MGGVRPFGDRDVGSDLVGVAFGLRGPKGNGSDDFEPKPGEARLEPRRLDRLANALPGKHETGFATTKMEELAAIAHCPFREATERAAQFRRQLMLPVRPFPRLARCDRGYWSTALHSGTTSNGAPWVPPKATGALPESADVAYRPHFRSSRKFWAPIRAARRSSE